MSSTKDSPALDLSSVSIEEEEERDEGVELSLVLSIGRGVGNSSKFQMESVENSSSELTNVAVTIQNKGDADLALRRSVTETVVEDPMKDSKARDAKRKREEGLDEPQMFQCGVSETEIGVAEAHLAGNSSQIESIEWKSFKDGERNSRNREAWPVVLQSDRNFGERVARTACSGNDNEETVGISPAGKTFMPSLSQDAAGTSKRETVIDPIPRKPTSESANPNMTRDVNKAKNPNTRQTSTLDTKPSEDPNSNSSGRQAFTPPQIPCVSTTGNGPNGRTITGFLYKYTNVEVSIVCVCHGTSFTPAEFVEHAGGMGISNPLRHIMVIPSFM